MTTATLDHILKEVDTVPEKILSFAGVFSDMDETDYADFSRELKQTREKNFNRNIAYDSRPIGYRYPF
ncbi:MAG: hypothetical protein LBO74_03595 [Candidatus Symbiothrix sp.]|nr:hypothetical protein [Candidatus Symbiothrix sp.]